MSKTSTTAKDRWNTANYDDIRIRVPKGAKEALERAANQANKSVNGYVNELLAEKMGVKSLKVYSVLVTEREHIHSALSGNIVDDSALEALDGIRKHEEVVIAESPSAANHEAIKRVEKLPARDDFCPDSTEYKARDLGEIQLPTQQAKEE